MSRWRMSVLTSSMSLKQESEYGYVWVHGFALVKLNKGSPLREPITRGSGPKVFAYKRNFSFQRGLNVCGFTEVARINFAGRAPLKDSRCSRLLLCSLRLNESLKLILNEQFSTVVINASIISNIQYPFNDSWLLNLV